MAQVSAIVQMIEAMLDPVSRAIANAPVEDEPEGEAERQAVAASKAWLEKHPGQGISLEDLSAISASPWMISSGHDRRVKKIIFTIPAQANVPTRRSKESCGTNVAVKQGCYIKTVDCEVTSAMQRFERSLGYAPNMHLSGTERLRIM